MKIGTGIYVKKSNEAVEMYKEAFGLTLGYNVKNKHGTYYHSELYKDDVEMLSVVESPDERHEDKTVQIYVILDTQDEVKKAFNILSQGGIVETPVGPLPWSDCAAALIDKFGVSWYLSVPQHYPGDDFTI